MKQAIEEKFILDVLEKYTTYKSYYEVQKSVEENPLFAPPRHRRSSKPSSKPAPEPLR
jgi:type I restriction enzyme R subunit